MEGGWTGDVVRVGWEELARDGLPAARPPGEVVEERLREARRGFYTQWESEMLLLAAALARGGTGWLRQSPALRLELEAIDGLIQSASGQLRDIPPRAIEEARLRRRVAISEELYKLLQQRHEEARLAAVTTIPDVRVLDPGSPGGPGAVFMATLPGTTAPHEAVPNGAVPNETKPNERGNDA